MSDDALALPAHARPRALCVPASAFAPFQGLLRGDAMNAVLDDVFFGEALVWVDRDLAENDPSFKQIIPYVVFLRGREVFHYARSKGGGEKRLHGLRSLGVGGHVEETDGPIENAYDAGLSRELSEELYGNLPHGIAATAPVALLYNGDGSGGVNDVHLGVVHVVQLGPSPAPFPAISPDLADPHFNHVVDAKRRVAEFEPWSQLVLKELL